MCFILGWRNDSWWLMGWRLKLIWLSEAWWMVRVPIHSWLICVLKRTLLDDLRDLDPVCFCQSWTHTLPKPKMKYKYSKVQFSNILLLEDFLLVQAKCNSAQSILRFDLQPVLQHPITLETLKWFSWTKQLPTPWLPYWLNWGCDQNLWNHSIVWYLGLI